MKNNNVHDGKCIDCNTIINSNNECINAECESSKYYSIIERLPKTKDGIIVIPLIDSVYNIIEGEIHEYSIKYYEDNRGWIAVSISWTHDRHMPVNQCYSTKEIAERELCQS